MTESDLCTKNIITAGSILDRSVCVYVFKGMCDFEHKPKLMFAHIWNIIQEHGENFGASHITTRSRKAFAEATD